MSFYQRKDVTEYFKTPDVCLEAMWGFFPEELKHLDRPVRVFDCCAGDGVLCHNQFVPKDIDFEFIEWDLNPRAEWIQQHNFLEVPESELPQCDIAILNSPFKFANEFIDKLLTCCKYIINLSPKSYFTKHWDNVVEAGIEPRFELPFMTSFGGLITTPIVIGLLKQLPPFHQPMSSKEKKTLFKQYIDRLVQERCHIQEWRKAFAYSAEHPELTANEVFEAIGWKPE